VIKPRTLWIGTIVGLLIYLVFAWGLGILLKLKGADLAMLGGGLSLLGIAAAGLLLWFLLPKTSATSGTAGSAEDLDGVVAAARAHLAASPMAKRADMNKLPMVVVLGPTGSAKTTTVVRSGLEPELLAGAVYRGDAVIPTVSANLWYGAGTVFFDAGGAAVADPASWAKITDHATPRTFGAAFTGRAQAPRAALVCVSCEEIIKPGAAPAAMARPLSERLSALAKKLGVKLPVYVIFTKADRLPYFADYVRNFSADEVREPLGVTLPADSGVAGSYADRMSPRLTNEFQTLFQSLAARRVELLPREHGNEYKPGAYEFPREFRKLGPPIVEFLLELCKPSALQVNPFLRGFYFTGVQAVVIQDVAPAAIPQQAASQPALAANATNVFARQAAAAAVAPAAAARGARRVPRWVFLDRLLRDIVLADDAAMAATRAGARIDTLRRTALALATAACIVFAIAWTVSFSGNKSLENGAAEAAKAVAVLPAVGSDLANVDALSRLDTLGEYLMELSDYEHNGAPLHLKWGLYTGGSLYPAVRAAYFDGFSKIMFDGTRTNLAAFLRNLPAAPRPTDDYATIYNDLEAYLMTTSEWKRSTSEFLTPVLMATWLSGRTVDTTRQQLAKRQFDRYASELALGNPYAGGGDLQVVSHSRTFLSQFAVADQIYQFRVIEASRVIPGVQFNKQFPGSAGAVVDNYAVPGAYTAAGWASMQNSINNVDKLLAGDAWVLGNDTAARVDRAKLRADLKARYAADYVKQWRTFLGTAAVLHFDGLSDASKKLLLLGGNQSPLLQLLQVTAQNTTIDTGIAGIFQPAATVTPPGTADKLVGDKNAPYINALLALQNNVQTAATAPAGQNGPAVDQARQSIGPASLAATQIAQGFRVGGDAAVAGTVQRLLQSPIDYANSLLRVVGKGPANGAGATFCSVAKPVLAKFPFNPAGTSQASAADVAAIFAPQTGALWKMYDGSLQSLLIKQGAEYAQAPTSAVQISPAFVSFFNRAAAVSAALFKPGSTTPELDMTLRPVAIPDALPAVSVIIDDATVRFTKRNPGPSPFVLKPGAERIGRVTALVNNQELTLAEASGPWAGFQLMQQADAWRAVGTSPNFDWALHSGPGTVAQLPNGTPIKFTFELSAGDAPAIMKPGYFSGFTCVPVVAP
jgi:type VI secretion system protein ImpL